MKKWVQAKCLEMCLNSKHNFYSAFSALFYSSSTEAQPLHEGSGHPTFKSHAEHGCSVIIHSLTSECNAVSSACIFSVQSIVQIFDTLKQLIHCVEITFSQRVITQCQVPCTLKTLRSDLTRKRVPWGQTHSWVRLIWNPGQNDPESESKMSF